MIRDITIGQYYPTGSPYHQLDPRTKLALTFGFIVSLFITKNLFFYGLAALVLLVGIQVSKVPLKYMLKGLRSIFIIILLTVGLNLFLTPGEDVLYTIWKLEITKEGALLAASMAIRLILLIVGSSLLTLTTSPIALTDAIEAVLKPFEKIKLPAHEIAMMMTIALRFIPILLEETDKIMKAQMARGADFESGGIIKKAKAMIPLLVPLFISAFRRADDLALAMEARCYRGGQGRTRMTALTYEKRDGIAYGLLVLYLAGFILGKALFV